MDKNKWLKLSRAQQLGNIGSEISRANYWRIHNDPLNQKKALERSLELLDLTLDDCRWKAGLKEIARFREVVSSWFCNEPFFNISLKELENYCTHFYIRKMEMGEK